MRYIPRSGPDEINRPTHSLLFEFIKLLFLLVLTIALIYSAMGYAVDIMAAKMSPDTEVRLGKFFNSWYDKDNILVDSPESEVLISVLNDLLRIIPEPRLDYSILFADNNSVNAIALPGGRIIFYKGLYDLLKDDRESLGFVIAHEIGHFENRDHLRGLGRGALVLALMLPFYGGSPASAGPASIIIDQLQLKYSRDQERRADKFAAGMIEEAFGGSGGALRALKILGEERKDPAVFSYLTTHPPAEERMTNIKNNIF